MAVEKKYILAIDKKLFKKQRKDLDSVMAKKEMAIDEGVMTKRETNSLEGIRNLLDSISDQLVDDEQDEKIFPNGFTSWMETHHEVTAGITNQLQMQEGKGYDVACQRGTGGTYELAEELTDKFELKYKKYNWGESELSFFETMEEFLEVELKSEL